MEPEPSSSDHEPKQSVWTSVTPVSKYAAMVLFIILPFVGGYVGYVLAPEKVVEVVKIVSSHESTVTGEVIKEIPSPPQKDGISPLKGYVSLDDLRQLDYLVDAREMESNNAYFTSENIPIDENIKKLFTEISSSNEQDVRIHIVVLDQNNKIVAFMPEISGKYIHRWSPLQLYVKAAGATAQLKTGVYRIALIAFKSEIVYEGELNFDFPGIDFVGCYIFNERDLSCRSEFLDGDFWKIDILHLVVGTEVEVLNIVPERSRG